MKTLNYSLFSLVTILFMCMSLNIHGSTTSCAQGDLTLQINFDNNHDDIHWAIYNSDYNAIESGGPFTNQSQNSTVTITLPSYYFSSGSILSGNGNFNLVIYDSSGNGLGNGSYTLSENSNIIAQSSSFTYSQATTFCHGNVTYSQLDVTPPTNPLNPRVKSTTNNSITLEWDASTDSESLLAYQINIDNSPYADSSLLSEYTFPAVAGTFYDIKIFAYDRMGNLAEQAALITVSTNGSNSCANGNLSLDLNFDAHPNEVSWQIKDTNNTVVDASNYQNNFYYTNAMPNTSLSESINVLGTGDYILVIYDANGNGGTTYNLSDSSNTLISGTTTGFSDVIQFCVGTTNVNLDTTAPTDPTNLTIINVNANNSLELSWSNSTDNEAVTEYGIFLFNSSISTYINYPIGRSTTNTFTTSILPAGINSITIVARDEAGNFSNRSNSVTLTVPSFTTIHEGFFETGWDGWIDGGSNAARPSNIHAFENNRSARLRNGTNSSKITLNNQTLSGYTAVEFSFHFKSLGVENNESFILEYFNGTSWTILKTFTKSIDFSNNQFYKITSKLSNNDYSFSNNSSFRISMLGNQNNDRIFVDQTKITGIIGGLHNSSNLIEQVPQVSSRNSNYEQQKIDFDKELIDLGNSNKTVKIYPNPANNYFSLANTNFEGKVILLNTQGKVIKTYQSNQKRYNISDLDNGLYYLKLEGNKNQKTLILIKK